MQNNHVAIYFKIQSILKIEGTIFTMLPNNGNNYDVNGGIIHKRDVSDYNTNLTFSDPPFFPLQFHPSIIFISHATTSIVGVFLSS